MSSGKIATLMIDDMGEGIDRRLGIVSKVANKFYDLINYWVTPGRKLRRRPPKRDVAGLLDPATQQTRNISGKVLTVLPAGTTAAHTITGVTVNTLYFDMPEQATSDWLLIDLAVFNTKAVALIAHRFNSAAAPWRTFFHVWDDKRPTYTLDPAFPTTWTESFPLHAFGKGKLGSYRNYTPRMAISNDRVFVTTASGNVGFCGANKPRVWNTRTPEVILTEGTWVYWISTNAPGDQTMSLPFLYNDLISDGKAAAYVLEYCKPDGTWAQLREVPFLSAYGEYKVAAIPNRWDATQPSEIRVTHNKAGDGVVFRFRMVPKATALIQTGLYITPTGKLVGGILTHEGMGDTIATYDIGMPLPNVNTPYFVAVVVPGAPISIDSATPGAVGTMPYNGQERYWSRIIANVISDGTGANLVYALTGTVTTTVGDTRVTGAGTAFMTQLEVGRQVEINGERRKVTFVGGDQSFEVDAPFSTAYTGTGLRDPRYRYAYEIGDAGNTWYAEQEADATFNNAGYNDAGYLGTAIYSNTGELPVSISTLQNRLMVQFPAVLQAWGVGPSAVTDMRLLAVDGQAAGINTSPRGALIDGYVALPTSNGVRLFSPTGNNKDYIEFVGAGDALQGIPLPNLTQAVWWPAMRTFLTCTTEDASGIVFYGIVSHQDTKVMAWTRWMFTGITRVDSMFVLDNDLIIQSGQTLHRVAALDTTYRDDGETTPYTSTGRWIYCDMGRPEKNKKLVRVEIIQEGKSSVAVYMNPFHVLEKTPGPPVVNGITMGRQRIPLMVMGPGIALEISSTDATGHQLESIGFDYLLLNR